MLPMLRGAKGLLYRNLVRNGRLWSPTWTPRSPEVQRGLANAC